MSEPDTGLTTTIGKWIAGIVAAVLAGVVLAVVTPMLTSGSGGDTPAKMGPLEPGTNRQGFDYDALGKPAGSPQLCAEMCRTDTPCKAMTYVLKGKRCWLKIGVPQVSANADMVSSVKVSP